MPSIGVVVLTQGTRPEALDRAVRSVRAQRSVETDIVVVGNGWDPVGLPSGIRHVALSENVGIPAGRNRGAAAVRGQYLFFLDDDAELPSESFLIDCVAAVRRNPTIGLIQPRLSASDGTPPPSRWVPRIRTGDPRTSSPVMSCLEAAVFLPRTTFDSCGGWAEPFFYAHEGIELAWRVWDSGHIAWYEGGLDAHHPVVHPTRHASFYRMNARNRVWLAKRNLPVVLIPLYVGSWTGIQIIRSIRNPRSLRAWFGGWFEGWRTSPGGRRALSWRTVFRMLRAGRPPVI